MSSTESKRQQYLTTVQGCYSAFAVRDLKAISDLSTEDCVYEAPGLLEYMPWARAHQGHDGIRQLWEELDSHLIFKLFDARQYIVDEVLERVVVIGRAECTARATGRTYINEWAHLFELRGGKVAFFREYPDTAAQLATVHPSFGP